VITQILGVLLGGVLSYVNFKTFSAVSLGHWMADNGRVTPAGYIYLAWIFPGAVVFSLYVVRNISIAFLLRDVVTHSRLHVLPLHPDRAGGLQPVGRLGLRNQYALTAIGLNFVAALAVGRVLLDGQFTPALIVLLIVLFVVYVVLSPVIFMAPLVPFRNAMRKSKIELQANVARRLLLELDQLYSRLSSGEIRAEDQGLVERLRSIATLIDEMPVWPFDASTLRRFLTAMVLPIVGTFSLPATRLLYEYVSR
jgi:hypothetical protein